MIRNRTAVITGSTSGIGLGLAERFAAAGCRVVINGVATTQLARDLVERLKHVHKSDVLYHPADLADPQQCTELIRDAEAHFGDIDILINNAGIQHVAPVEQFPAERWDAILAVNLSASFHTIRAALPGMQTRNRGRIVNIASVHGLVASINKAAYVAAKHGILGLTKVVALENATRGITCNARLTRALPRPAYPTTPHLRNCCGKSSPPDGSRRSKISPSSLCFCVHLPRRTLPGPLFRSMADGWPSE